MDAAASQERQARLENTVREQWGARDPDAVVSSVLHDDGKVDLTVVSAQFAGKSGLEREAFFWPAFASVPRSDLLHMTYCLLLTPEEAARHFARAPVPQDADNADNWAE